MMTPHQTALTSLLLGSFPTFQSGDGAAALGAYEWVFSQADERDLQPGIAILVNGQYPGHDGRFAPTAPQLATAIRMARDKRLNGERLNQLRLAPPPVEEISEEEQARVKAGFDQLVKDLSAKLQTDDAAADVRRKALFDRTNARFAPDMSPEAQRKRLGFDVGDPEGQEDAA
ncbi:MAG: hypothetical protein JWM16_6327 [Verrucomicrobiales bacterium]|nr:hypothetical protein [Verrucomicrobiales bacterium]